MFSSSEIGVYGFLVFLDLVPKLLGRFKGVFSTDWSEVGLLKQGVLEIEELSMVDGGYDQLSSYV